MIRGRKVVELWGEASPVDDVSPVSGVDHLDPTINETAGRDLSWQNLAPDEAFDQPQRASRIPALLAGTCGLAWIGFVAASGWPALAHSVDKAPLIAQLVSTAATPIIVLSVFWSLLRARKVDNQASLNASIERLRREQAAIASLVAESEARLAEGAQSLHSQIEQLDAVGEQSLNRIATLRAMLGEEIGQIGMHTNGLKNAAAAARSDMAVLLANLPKAHVETRKVVVALQDAGLGAQEHAHNLKAQLSALALQGQDAGQIASSAAETLAGRMTQMESQSLAMRALVEESQTALTRTGEQGAAEIEAKIERITRQIDGMGEALNAHNGLSTRLFDQLRAALADVEGRLAAIDTHGTERTERLSQAILALTNHSHTLRDALASGGDRAEDLITKSEALMVALDASAREIDETLPAAFRRLSDTATAAHGKIAGTAHEIELLEGRLRGAHAALEATHALANEHAAGVETTQQHLAACEATARVLDETLRACDTNMLSLAEGASVKLIDALMRVRETAQHASERARDAIQTVIPEAATALSDATQAAMDKALTHRVEAQMAHIAEVAQRAIDAADKATERLMRQTLTISEASNAFATQLNETERQQETAGQATLSRRVSLLIESLNSIAIDVTKIFASDVTDAAWASYLKGDRGVFTRRAVRLLDSGNARDILRHYDADDTFRDHVNHYIHDFEAMMRAVLGTRDGGPLSVTLLSSDMGKLYVALAHAIERLRT